METKVASLRNLLVETGISIASFAVITLIVTSDGVLRLLKWIDIADHREDFFVLTRVMYFSLGAFTVFALIQWLRERPLSGTTTLAAMALAQPLSAVFAISSLPLGTYPPPSFGVSLLSLPYTLLQEVVQLDKGFVAHFLFSGLGFRYVIPNLICPVLAVPISLFLAKQIKYFLMARSSVSKLRVEK